MYPFFSSRLGRSLEFVSDLPALERRLKRSRLEALLLVEGNKFDPVVKSDYLRVFKIAKERGARLGFFATGANPAQINQDYLDIVDVYFKPTLLEAPFEYGSRYIGGKVWADWLERNGKGLGSQDMGSNDAVQFANFEKLMMSWNVGIGLYPRTALNNRIYPLIERTVGPSWAIYLKPRVPKFLGQRERRSMLHARMSVHDANSYVAMHRRLALETATQNVPTLVGKVSSRIYLKELAEVSAVLSPFGSGEVCYRDFEAAHCGAALIKPEMSHLRTWPDIYRPDCYFPTGWDSAGLVEAFRQVKDLGPERARSAFEVFRQAYDDIETRVEGVVQALVSSRKPKDPNV